MKKALLLVAIGFAVNALLKQAGKRNASPLLRSQNAGSLDESENDDLGAAVEGEDFDEASARPVLALAEGEDVAVLSLLQQFDAHTIALAETALSRSVGNDTRSVATLLLEEHTRNQMQLRTLRSGLAVEAGEFGQDGAARIERDDDAALLAQLDRLDSGTFEAGWTAAARESHTRMLERIDDALLTGIEDTRLAEHVALVRDDARAQLQNLDALSGRPVGADVRAA